MKKTSNFFKTFIHTINEIQRKLFKKNIYETSIIDFYVDRKLLGDSNDDKYFSDKDRKLLSKYKKSLYRLSKAFSKTPYKFRLFVIDISEILGMNSEEYDIDYAEAIKKIGGTLNSKIPQQFGIKPKEGEITIVFVANLGGIAIPLTPWIFGHRIGHLFQDEYDNSSDNINSPIMQKYILLSKTFKRLSGFLQTIDKMVNTGNNETETYYKLFNTKSSRERNLVNSYEILPEILAECIIKGKITLKIPNNTNRMIKIKLRYFETTLNKYANDLLKECLGKVLVAP